MRQNEKESKNTKWNDQKERAHKTLYNLYDKIDSNAKSLKKSQRKPKFKQKL